MTSPEVLAPSVLGLCFLFTAALALRACAAALRTDASNIVQRCAGWLLAGVAAWLAAGAAGAWAPLWPALLIAAIGIFARAQRSIALRSGCDAALVAGLGVLSVPMLAPGRIAATVLVVTAAWLSLDLLPRRCTTSLRLSARLAAAPIAIGAVAFIVFALLPPIGERAPRGWQEAIAPSTGIAPAIIPGESRIVLDTGAVAWFDRPPGEPSGGALFFHGAHADGSHQPAALVVRRALIHAGFAVLAVDRAGYGASPHPRLDAEMAAWDPLPTDLAAYRVLSDMLGVGSITVVGHSMGNFDVLALLGAGVPLDLAVMMGAALSESDREEETEAYWDQRFFSDRRITVPPEGFPVREIHHQFLDLRRFVFDLPPQHAPVYFVSFGIEWPNLVADRDRLYQLLPGPKQRWMLDGATHYLSTEDLRRIGLVIGDTRVARRVATALESLRQSLSSME